VLANLLSSVYGGKSSRIFTQRNHSQTRWARFAKTELKNNTQMKKVLLLFVILTVNLAFSQKRFESAKYGFSIEEPHNWQIANNDEILKNLDKYDLTDEALDELLKKNKGSILLTSFYKYETNKHAGLIPTIK